MMNEEANQLSGVILIAVVAGFAFVGALGGVYVSRHPLVTTTYTFTINETKTGYGLTFYPTATINATVTRTMTANSTRTVVTTITNTSVTTSTSYYVSTVTTTVTTTA